MKILNPKHYELWIGGLRSDLNTSWNSIYIIFIGGSSFGGQSKDYSGSSFYEIYQFDSCKGLVQIGSGFTKEGNNEVTKTHYTLNGVEYSVEGFTLSHLFQRIGLKPEFEEAE